LTDGRYCDKHAAGNSRAAQRQEFDRLRDRQDPWREYYDTAQWRRTRAFVLARDPVCKSCGRAASVVCDHTIRASLWLASGHDFYDLDNLQGLCKRCHDSKTAKEVGFAGAHR
jgi:5-methylcytosine-specific restriction protein A